MPGVKTCAHQVRIHRMAERRLPRPGLADLSQGLRPSKKYPMIVEVHGGPSASAGPRGGTQWAELGYFDFQPNPRGSFGQGEKFVQANRQGLRLRRSARHPHRHRRHREESLGGRSPHRPHRLELRRLHEHVRRTQTNRFRTIVAGAGISDWKSYYGENSIDQWMIPFFGASVYDDPAVYAKSSAIEYIKNAKTPCSSSSATATANALLRRASRCGTPCARRRQDPTRRLSERRPWLYEPCNTSATGWNAKFAGLRRTCPPAITSCYRSQAHAASLHSWRLAALLFLVFLLPDLTIPVLPICSSTVQPLNWRLESFRS
jgi:hypothetical protein